MADLVSRKPSADTHGEPLAVAPEVVALEYKPAADDEAHPDITATAAARSVEPMETQAKEAPPAPIVDNTEEEASRDSSDVAEPEELPALSRPEDASPTPTKSAPQKTEAAATLVQPVPTRRKKLEPIAEPVVSADQTDATAPPVAAGPKSLLDEMAELDADVAGLRRQLAKKLVEQNAQLRKMLARFDAR